MLFQKVILLAFIQGITEFLPVSSSGHLIWIPKVLRWSDQGLMMDVAVHLGTLVAILIYFRKDIIELIKGVMSISLGKVTPSGRQGMYLMIASIPAVIFGLFLHDIMGSLRNLWVIGSTTLIYGILLGLVDRYCSQKKDESSLTITSSLWVGVAQALALIPGTSRSGACMTMMRFMGFNREAAARFTFLMAIPVIMGAGLVTGYKSYQTGWSGVSFAPLFLGVVVSFGTGWLTIWGFLGWVRRSSLMPFMWYRIILGIGLLLGAWWGVGS
jgi:undecaprenyl-diphosphatase